MSENPKSVTALPLEYPIEMSKRAALTFERTLFSDENNVLAPHST